jgi:uncharacterized protein
VADQLTAYADVPTAVAARYAKQLASHLGRRAEVRSEPEGERVVLDVATTCSCPAPPRRKLRATASTPEAPTGSSTWSGRTSSASASATGSS